jgi:hypothetical protein
VIDLGVLREGQNTEVWSKDKDGDGIKTYYMALEDGVLDEREMGNVENGGIAGGDHFVNCSHAAIS